MPQSHPQQDPEIERMSLPSKVGGTSRRWWGQSEYFLHYGQPQLRALGKEFPEGWAVTERPGTEDGLPTISPCYLLSLQKSNRVQATWMIPRRDSRTYNISEAGQTKDIQPNGRRQKVNSSQTKLRPHHETEPEAPGNNHNNNHWDIYHFAV